MLQRFLRYSLQIALLIVATYSIAMASNTETLENQLVDILRPRVVTIDRTLVLFRYEEKDLSRFNPQTLEDVNKHEARWAKRFYDSSQRFSNSDGGGPGLYTSTDPVATAAFGRSEPALFVFSLPAGSQVFFGHGDQVSAAEELRARDLFHQMECGSNVEFTNDHSDIVTKFRRAENVNCRKALIKAFERLNISSITYPFYSAPIESCRATGVAINIVNTDALDLHSTNYYTNGKTVEGSKSLTPFISALFHETKSYFHTQSILPNERVLENYRAGYGFFDSKLSAYGPEYARWKADHILNCGAKWPTELPDWRVPYNLNQMKNKDNAYQELYIRTAMAYQSRNFAHTRELPAKDVFKLTDLNELKTAQKKYLKTFENFGSTPNPDVLPELNRALLKLDAKSFYHPLAHLFELRKIIGDSAGAIYVYNLLSDGSGYPPALKGMLPSSPGPDAERFTQQNRTIAMKVLERCRSVYLDLRISNDEVVKGACGSVTGSD